MKTLLQNLIALFITVPALAAPQTFGVAARPDGSTGVVFRLPYTGGTHTGHARRILGGLQVDPGDLTKTTGHLIVPIASIVTGDLKRDCHMRESLGLDYSASKFPEEHVCDNNQQLQPTGPDSVVFPTIEFNLTGASAGRLQPGVATPVTVHGRFFIHGIQRVLAIPATVTLTAQNQILVQAKGGLRLADFGIIVKKFLFINVGESAQIDLNLLFARAQ